MNTRVHAFLGVTGLLLAYLCIGVSISLSPWFSWHKNALSDLGHSVDSAVAPIFNFGLLFAGFLTTIYATTVFRQHAKHSSICLVLSALSLQLVATFNEVYGFLHFTVSVLLFACLGATSVVYAIEKKSLFAVIVFIVGLASWMVYGFGVFTMGVAVPETISSVAVVTLILRPAIKECVS